MKHKKRTRFTIQDLKVWCDKDVDKEDIVNHWKDCTCIECLKKAVFGTNKKGYYIDEISRIKAREQYDLLKGGRK